MPSDNELLLYQTEDGDTKIEVTLKGENVWLTQADMVQLFQRDQSVISRHINEVFKSGELEQNENNMHFLHIDGSKKPVTYFGLDVIISVGYKVNSHRGVQFRIWATKTLREYIVKGFAINDERLSEGQSNYFDELVERVRRIRTSEANFYEKVRNIFSTSIDYHSSSEHAKVFYATVQNKFHYAIHGHTASELIASRIDSEVVPKN